MIMASQRYIQTGVRNMVVGFVVTLGVDELLRAIITTIEARYIDGKTRTFILHLAFRGAGDAASPSERKVDGVVSGVRVTNP